MRVQLAECCARGSNLEESLSWFLHSRFANLLKASEKAGSELDRQHGRRGALVDRKLEPGTPEVPHCREQQRGVDKAIRSNCIREPQDALQTGHEFVEAPNGYVVYALLELWRNRCWDLLSDAVQDSDSLRTFYCRLSNQYHSNDTQSNDGPGVLP